MSHIRFSVGMVSDPCHGSVFNWLQIKLSSSLEKVT